MNNLQEALRGIKAIVVAKTIKGTSFVGVREYLSQKGELSNQTLLVGYNYVNILKKDKEKLLKTDISSIIEKYGEKVATEALEELLVSLAKLTATEEEKEQLRKEGDATIGRSDAQTAAYTQLAKGIRLHADGKLHVTGIVVRKQVLKEGEYKEVNSRPKTLAKKDIKKLADLSNEKVRTFIFNDMNELRLRGVEV